MSSSSPKPFPICTIPKEMKQKKSFFIQGHWCLTAETIISPLQLTKGVISDSNTTGILKLRKFIMRSIMFHGSQKMLLKQGTGKMERSWIGKLNMETKPNHTKPKPYH